MNVSIPSSQMDRFKAVREVGGSSFKATQQIYDQHVIGQKRKEKVNKKQHWKNVLAHSSTGHTQSIDEWMWSKVLIKWNGKWEAEKCHPHSLCFSHLSLHFCVFIWGEEFSGFNQQMWCLLVPPIYSTCSGESESAAPRRHLHASEVCSLFVRGLVLVLVSPYISLDSVFQERSVICWTSMYWW